MIEGQFNGTQYFKILSIHYKISPVTIFLFLKMLVIRAISTGKVESQNKKGRCTSLPCEKVFDSAPLAVLTPRGTTWTNLTISS